MGWLTGIEPASPGSRPGALAIELQPQCPAQDLNLSRADSSTATGALWRSVAFPLRDVAARSRGSVGALRKT